MKLKIGALVLTMIVAMFTEQSGAETNTVFTLNKPPTTFTNLQNRIYENVFLLRTNTDGIVYGNSNGAAVGFISYTNLSPALLESWHIPTNLIGSAAERAIQRSDEIKAKQILAVKNAEEILKAKKKAAFEKGYRAGNIRGAKDEAAGEPRPNKERLDGLAKMDGFDFWVSPITGRGTMKNAQYDSLDKSLRADFLAGFRSGYAEGFKKSEKPAF